jgi:hypothetical protein
MATSVYPVGPEHESTPQSPEQALCAMFDLFEDAIENMTAEKRKAWLEGLSEAAEKLEKQP